MHAGRLANYFLLTVSCGVHSITITSLADTFPSASAVEQKLIEGTVEQGDIRHLKRLGFDEAAPVLSHALRYSDYYVRSAACRTIGELGDCRGVSLLQEALTKTLAEPDEETNTVVGLGGKWDQAVTIAQTLNELDCQESSAVLTGLLNHPLTLLRYFAADGLLKRGHKSAVPTLIELLHEDVDLSRSSCGVGRLPACKAARWSLQRFTYQCFMDETAAWQGRTNGWRSVELDNIENKDPCIVPEDLIAASAPAWSNWWVAHSDRTRRELRNEAFSWASHAIDDPRDCYGAITRMCLIGDDQACQFLRNFIHRTDIDEKYATFAVATLGDLPIGFVDWLESPRVQDLLLDTLEKHPSAKVRLAAAKGLDRYRKAESATLLIQSLADPVVAPGALQTLCVYTSAVPFEMLAPFLAHKDARIREDAARLARRSQDPGAVEQLREHVQSETDPDVLVELLTAMQTLAGQNSMIDLYPFVRHTNASVRRAAVKGLEVNGQVQFRIFDYTDDEPNTDGWSRVDAWWKRQAPAP